MSKGDFVDNPKSVCLRPYTGQFPHSHALEPTGGERVLYLGLSSQKGFVDNVEIQEPLGSSDHITKYILILK